MLPPLLLIAGSIFLSINLQAADFFTSRDVLDALLEDGCARPIADESVKTMPALASSCLAQLIDGEDMTPIILPKRVKNWGSNGSGDGVPRRFLDEDCNQFFIALHERISTYIPGLHLSPHDLFHGHLLSYGPSGKDHLAVVFHAKEYPSNLAPEKIHYQIPTESFASTDEEFRQRNFLYLSHRDALSAHNEIVLLEERGMCEDFFSQLSANTLSEGIIESVLENGKLLGDVNVFLPHNLSRIKYQFYPGFDSLTGDFIVDYEALDAGKSLIKRLTENQMMDILLYELHESPLVYFLTGR